LTKHFGRYHQGWIANPGEQEVIKMSEMRFSMAGDSEDDILAYRTAPFPLRICDTSKSSMSTLSNGTSVGHDAFLLSQATNQATGAAHSILAAGGTESTALNTAKAAAASVLRNEFEKKNGFIGGGPKEWFFKRRIKKQAEVVASMALVVAANTMHQQEDNFTSGTDTGTERSDKYNSSISTVHTSKLSILDKVKSLREGGKRGRSGKGNTCNAKVSPVSSGEQDSTNIFRTVAITVGKPEESPKKKTPFHFLELGNEEPIYALNCGTNTKSADSSDKGYTPHLDDVLSSTSETTWGNATASASTLNTYGDERGCMVGNLNPLAILESMNCLSPPREEVGFIPEQAPIGSFSVTGERFGLNTHVISYQSPGSSDIVSYNTSISNDEDRIYTGRRESSNIITTSNDEKDTKTKRPRGRSGKKGGLRLKDRNSTYEEDTDDNRVHSSTNKDAEHRGIEIQQASF